ncbi:hypothetical protein N5079_27125 [Planotetraspora sp. A-T 1434]|uniref:hypothetical protein n=1 Tax=Planotetraspora sp. A-T 1434 TaxID=2979219 RepID=UPI0021BFF6FF|nr:hypothetical protein [Planotetraspora sp. A-T 1434]MCT9933891.1 hypothetical protein [Planotetraspora sp. A-T 1434]
MRKIRVFLVLATATASFTLAGCGTDGAVTQSQSSLQREIDISVLRVGHYNYIPFDTPEKLATSKVTQVVAQGEVAGFAAGRTIVGADPNDKRYYVVMDVKVTRKLKGVVGTPADQTGHVYVELFRGPVCNDTMQPCRSIDDFNRAIPSGTKILLFGNDGSTPFAVDANGHSEGDDAGRPKGSPLLRPYPQGLLLEQTTASGKEVLGGLEEDIPKGWLTPSITKTGLDAIADRVAAAGFNG